MTTSFLSYGKAGGRVPRLSATDLNLLVALDALLEEANVTRAAARIGVSQSAMSHSLRRLRHLMNDPILTRVGNEMRPSARALALRAQVREAVLKAEAVLAPPEQVDPRTLKRTFKIQAYDTTQILLLPGLAQRLEIEAPRVRIETQDLSLVRLVERLSAAETDLALFWTADLEIPESIVSESLFADRHVALVRQGHPCLPGPLDWATYAAFRHLIVLPRGTPYPLSRAIENAMADQGFERKRSLVVSGLLAVPAILAATDHISIVSERAADILSGCFSLVKVEPPFATMYHNVSMLWATRHGQDPALRWLRRVIQELCADLDQAGVAEAH